MWMPPVTVNSASSSRMNGMYSASSVCTTCAPAWAGPSVTAYGSSSASDQKAATFP